MGIFPTNCWLGTKSAGLLSHLNQDHNVSHANMGDSQHKRGPSLCEHVQTCKHRPSDALCMASVSEGGETPKTNLSIALTDKSGPSWKLVCDVGGWVASCSQTTEGRAGVLVDKFLTDLTEKHRLQSDVMGMAKMTTPTHDRALPSFRHCNYWKNIT